MPVGYPDRRIDPFFKVQNVVLDRYAKALGPIGLLVYVALCRRAGQELQCWPELRDICQLTGYGMTAVRDGIIRCELVGLVEVGVRHDERGQRGNVYILHEPRSDGPPAEWADGFPKDARLYRTAPRPVREEMELPQPLRKKTPPPHRVAVGGAPSGGGGATVERRGRHRGAVGLPLMNEEEELKKGDQPIEGNGAKNGELVALLNEAKEKLRKALSNVGVGCGVPPWMQLSDVELEMLGGAAEIGPRQLGRDLAKYRKGIGT